MIGKIICGILAIGALWTFWLSCDKSCPVCGGKTDKAGNDYHCPKCRKLWHMNVFGMLKQRRTDYEDRF